MTFPVTSQVSELEEGVEGRRKDVDHVSLCSPWFTPAMI